MVTFNRTAFSSSLVMPAAYEKWITHCNYNYRPKRSFGQGNVFTPVCDSVNRGGVPDQAPPRDQAGTPPDQAGTPPDQAGTPGTRHPPPRPGRYPPPRPGRNPPPDQGGTPLDQAGTPQDQTPPPGPDTPPGTADSRIRSTFGRYASYWNAFLFIH